MSFISQLTKIIEEREKHLKNVKLISPVLMEEVGKGSPNVLCHGDNLVFMKSLLNEKKMAGKINMIYIDPPFFSKANYDATVHIADSNIKLKAYEDRWNYELIDYLKMLDLRLAMMKKLLADDGLIWLHLDWHVVHYAKILMDEIFGSENFVNEIIWTYKSGGSTKRHFARKHDTILVYSKSKNYKFYPLEEKSYNRDFKPYRFNGVEEFEDERGWYTKVNMKDVWTIDMVGRTSGERTGYATQKPEQLIKRIIESATKEGDICADFFCGSGTLPAVCSKLNRKFIACDAGNLSVESTENRLIKANASFRRYEIIAKDKSPLKVNFKVVSLDNGQVKIEIKKLKEKTFDRLASKKDLQGTKDTFDKNSLAFIESFTIDYNFDGSVHRPTVFFQREKGEIVNLTTGAIGKSGYMSIKFTDVFGNTYFERISNEGLNKK